MSWKCKYVFKYPSVDVPDMSAVKSQSSLTEQSGMQAVDLTKLNLMQLTQFKQGLDTDLQFYQESLQNLKHAQSK